MVDLSGIPRVAREKEKERVGEKATTIRTQKTAIVGPKAKRRTLFGNATSVAWITTIQRHQSVVCARPQGSNRNGTRRSKKRPQKKIGKFNL